jgi:hypothetical protein
LSGEGQVSLVEFSSWYRDNIENTKESWGSNPKKMGADSMVSGGRKNASADEFNSNA